MNKNEILEHENLHKKPTSAMEILRKMGRKTNEVQTDVRFYRNSTSFYEWKIYEGVSLLCGALGHGVTSLMLNVAINTANKNIARYKSGIDNRQKSVVFISYDESKARISQRLFSIWKDRTENKTKEEFFNRYLASGAIVIVALNSEEKDLVGLIKYGMSKFDISLLLVDYLQLIPSNNERDERKDEIVDIMIALHRLAIGSNLPILVGSQLKTDGVRSEDDITNFENIVDGEGMPECISKSVVCIYNRNFQGKQEMYVVLAKDRDGGYSKGETLFFDQETGKLFVGEEQ